MTCGDCWSAASSAVVAVAEYDDHAGVGVEQFGRRSGQVGLVAAEPDGHRHRQPARLDLVEECLVQAPPVRVVEVADGNGQGARALDLAGYGGHLQRVAGRRAEQERVVRVVVEQQRRGGRRADDDAGVRVDGRAQL
jgi:hypothetical protein